MSQAAAAPRETAGATSGPWSVPLGNLLFALALLLFCGASVALLATRYFAFSWLPTAALALFLLLYRLPELGYWMIVFLIPFGGFRKIEGPVSLNLPWILASVLGMVITIQLLPGKAVPPSLRSGIWRWLLPWFSLSLISAAMSDFPQTAFLNVGYLMASYLFMGLGMILLTEESICTTLPAVLVTSVSLSSLLAVLGYFLNIPLLAEKHGELLVRGVGGAIDPNNMSLMILFALPFLVHALLWSAGWGMKLLSAALIAVNLLGIVTTYSRGGAVMLAVTLILLAIAHRRLLTPRNVGLMVAIAGLGLAAFLLLLPVAYWERQATLLDWADTALERRASYLEVGAEAALANPVLGAGPGTFREIYSSSQQADRLVKISHTRRRFAHNTYLEVLVGTGVLGLFLFLGALVHAWRCLGTAIGRLDANRDAATASIARSWRIAFLVVVLYLLIFSDVYHKYLLLALAVAPIAARLEPRVRERAA